MPRPRKNDPTSLIKPFLSDFARQIASEVERLTLQRVRHALDGAVSGIGARGLAPRARRATVLCYYPGCRNVAAPRFGMFCAAEHKGLSAGEKEKYRKQHAGKTIAARRAVKK
jgi:hypothetical protein